MKNKNGYYNNNMDKDSIILDNTKIKKIVILIIQKRMKNIKK